MDSEDNSAPRGERGIEQFSHVSVLSQEAIDFLAIRRGGTYLDATLGLGGHSYEIAKRLGAQGHLIALDKDTNALEMARRRLEQVPDDLKEDWPQITLLHASFAEMKQHIASKSLDGVLADLGISSMQLQDAGRGFSFQAEGPLDMRMNPHGDLTAEQVVNHTSERELADVIYEFGEERRSRRIARAICRARPIRTTAHLAQVISVAARPMNQAERRIHPATKTFQALRIFVNHELDDLKELLASVPSRLVPRGRLVVISFHSLEDRIVKDSLRDGASAGKYELLTKKPVTATEEEIDRNPRSRSAKLRAAARK
ncbi:methyltransferase [Candidatus Koribacter versatilis Ellin345]|uniref:Ribosomal RNA small subunit methyltransferase H n=1 Tax=Koribacter versatilis (strain Ellin345) TaxID=204669 RepID=RSMH_KORVE|nr:16S rRNA (cytosine(1402)-N(4))-methyltransferase RsmH [Candidatus Koribacter versatilis]Q1IKG1.1 RecName: Full=Ribosomal RNA small subunit methyltransferase H; AltName: Full=16S rRNA m(4)C1402 methyltransferase; AltName: Full=rRNA (cytosine-N(4)-)-methyltransferase RsmH [Candidatus Koribacter versatilis Ellin345]ABF42639.1 methyltransferase [Candidatus Koribacter versatilis Ellin345]